MSTQPSEQKFRRVLIANRGEIAIRIARALREMDIESIMVYSDADENSQHISHGDWAYRLGGRASSESYLNLDKLKKAIESTGADAVHPGYGFLSENAEFARMVRDCGVKFIGPSPETMENMGDKIKARKLMHQNGVPTVPGCESPLEGIGQLESMAREIGLPIILKAAAGGGGRGMRVVQKEEDLAASFEACKREALAYFGNDQVFCEKYVEEPRHIEFQVLFDSHGNGIHLFERDCSTQRRHQKLFEEAPSPFLTPQMRQEWGSLAVKAAQSAGYEGAGTVEFIVDKSGAAYFMEMNTRIQVEHPVTEAITGIDLIKAQISVAQGQALPWQQSDVHLNGWAMEARINAESPEENFRPEPGTVQQVVFPSGPFIRVDSHLYSGYEIPKEYDSMVAKIIAWGQTREEARLRLLSALKETVLIGIPTTVSFHDRLLRHDEFKEGQIHTGFLAAKGHELYECAPNDSSLGSHEPHLVGAYVGAYNKRI